MMDISKGSVNDYVMWACNAILKHRDQVIKCPDKRECRNISVRIRNVHGFVNCVGVIDVILVNGEDWYTRKGD